MQAQQSPNLMLKLAIISSAVEKIRKSLRLYVTKLAYLFGVNQFNPNKAISPKQISALAFFLLLIKGVKHTYSYGDLYTHCLLNKPRREEFYELIGLVTISQGISLPHKQVIESQYRQFSMNQEGLLKQQSIKRIDRDKLEETFAAFFASSKGEEAVVSSLDQLINEATVLCNYFKDLGRLLASLARNGISNSIDYIFSRLKASPSSLNPVIKRQSVVCARFNPFSMLQWAEKGDSSPKDTADSVHSKMSYSNAGYSFQVEVALRLFNPVESITVLIKEKTFKVSVDFISSSSFIRKRIVNCIRRESAKLRGLYGRVVLIFSTSLSKVDIHIDSQVVNVNRQWLGAIIYELNMAFLYRTAKDIIDNCYLKWLLDANASSLPDEKSTRTAFCIAPIDSFSMISPGRLISFDGKKRSTTQIAV